jgi:hypothetical protein
VERRSLDLKPGEVVTLYDGDASVGKPNSSLSPCRLLVTFDWLAGTHLRFDCVSDPAPLLGSSAQIDVDGTAIAVLVNSPTTAVLPGRTIVGDPESAIDEIEFQVCNFPPYLSSADPLEFRCGGWRVQLRQHRDARDRVDVIRNRGGGAVTHVGVLTDTSASTFSWNEAESILSGFAHFLDWAASDRVPLLGERGVRDNEVVVQAWGDPKRHIGRSSIRWLSSNHPHVMQSMWLHFADYWQETDWRSVLTLTSELYADSHHSAPLELRTVTAWLALESFSWQWLTKNLHLDPFYIDDKHADWRIRKMLGSMAIPTDIPDTLSRLRGHSQGQDGPKTLALLRNDIVHPKEGQDLLQLDGVIKQEAWRLTTWYLELALLRACGSVGPYIDRTQALPINNAIVVDPPWV